MKRALLGMMLLFAPIWAAKAEPVIVALTDSTPNFSMPGPDGKYAGINVDLAKLVCKRMQIECVYRPMPLAQLIGDISAGRAEIGFGNLIQTPERETKMLFSQPYWRSSTAFIGRVGGGGKTQADMVRGKRIAVQAGSRQEKWLNAKYSGTISAVSRPTIGEVVEALSQGGADLALAPMMTVYPFLMSERGQGFAFLGEPIDSGWPVHVVVAKNRADLLARLDEALESTRRDGSMGAVVRNYVPFDIF